jgi:DNA-directed RNA polymerase subunit M/transcription elongation factor TFIIS
MIIIVCSECNNPIEIPDNIEENEIILCICCGTEYEYKNKELNILQLDGIDYGE